MLMCKRIAGSLLLMAGVSFADSTPVELDKQANQERNVNQPISKALRDLFDDQVTAQKMPVRRSSYLKVIASKTAARSTMIYRCENVLAKSIRDSIESATTATGTVEISEEQNIITINDENGQMDELKDLLVSLDTRGPQVLVEAQIVEVQMGDSSEWDPGLNVTYFDSSQNRTSSIGSVVGERLGFTDFNSSPTADAGASNNYPTNSGGWFDLNLGSELANGDIFNLNSKLKWLQSHNKAEILSSPNILVDLGTTAEVSTGTDQPLLNISVNNGVTQESVYYKRTGVNLRVTPELINDDTVSINVRPEVTSVIKTENLSATSKAPVISVRNINTKLNVKNGGVVMMGGLFSSKSIESEEKVPYLSAIPLLGELFRSTNTEEVEIQLLFLLKVTIVPNGQHYVLNNLDNSKKSVKGASKILIDKMMPPEKQEDGDDK